MDNLMVIVAVRSLSHVRLFMTPWTAAHQASLSFTVSQSLLKLMSIESVMPSINNAINELGVPATFKMSMLLTSG